MIGVFCLNNLTAVNTKNAYCQKQHASSSASPCQGCGGNWSLELDPSYHRVRGRLIPSEKNFLPLKMLEANLLQPHSLPLADALSRRCIGGSQCPGLGA